MKQLEVLAKPGEDGRIVLSCPGVGIWRRSPALGSLASAGQSLGVLSTLGREQELIVPRGVRGVIVERGCAAGECNLAYGDAMLVLGDAMAEQGADGPALSDGAELSAEGALVFRSNSSGRFYLRPAPDKPAFVSVGDEIEEGQTVFLLEVMKTFSRVSYGGKGLPARAKVLRILAADGDDLEAGQAVLELETL